MRNILFDFDGVIIDSMPVRNKGFEILFSEYPAAEVAGLMDYHRRNGGLSRYVKIRYFFEQIRGEKITEEQVMALAEKFSAIMRRELVNPALLDANTLAFIRSVYKDHPLHIVSGSDGNELRFLCEELKISQYFLSMEGSPTPKIKLVADLLTKYGYVAGETVLIGDSVNDYEAAKQNGITFWGYNNPELRHAGSFYIEDFKEVKQYLAN